MVNEMIIKNNEELKQHTTVRIGGMAKNYYIPESIEELREIIQKLNNEVYWLLGGGSNLLINDEQEYENVISLLMCNDKIEDLGEGHFYVGCSVKLYSLIVAINEKGYGGIEYLASVPGSVGGAVVMNAGRGRKYHQCISDYIEKVIVLEQGQLRDLSKEECGFEHRNSILKNSDKIVVGVYFRFKEGSSDFFKRKREERLIYSKKEQDYSGYNFGSVFRDCSPLAMRLIRVLGIGKKDKIHFSSKTSNWIVNHGAGTYKEAVHLIDRAKKINRFFGKKVKLEVIIWDNGFDRTTKK